MMSLININGKWNFSGAEVKRTCSTWKEMTHCGSSKAQEGQLRKEGKTE